MFRQDVLLLGASNLVLGWQDLIRALRSTIAEPFDLNVAMGMGRSYMSVSSFCFRQLPAIRSCGLWDQLPQDPKRPPYVLITDLGNDIVYLFEPERIAAIVRECLVRIRDWHPEAKVVMTGLPLASLASVGRARFLIARTILFPGCRLSLPTILEQACSLDQLTRQLADEFDVPIVEPEPHWYGMDPIHVLPKFRPAAFTKYFAAFGHTSVMHATNDSPRNPLRIQLPSPADSTRFGFKKTVEQPDFRAPEFTVAAW